MLFQLLRSEAELQSQNINYPIFRLPFSQYPQESPKMSQTLPLSQINQSTGAKRTIVNMAKKMRLDPAWLHTLLSLHWNYDKVGREAMGWVTPTADADFAAAIAPYCTGNKKFRQEVLQALSYAGLLQVNGHPVCEQYLPDCQNQYSTHFMSNEWSYPLRFWNDGQKAA